MKNFYWEIWQNNKVLSQCHAMFHLTACKIQLSFTGLLVLLPWLPLNSLEQSICSHRTNINQSRQNLFYLVNVKQMSNKKIKQKALSSFFPDALQPVTGGCLVHFVPFHPGERERLGPLLDQICSICQCYSRNWPASLPQTITHTHTPTSRHTHDFFPTVPSLPLPSPPIWLHGPSGRLQCSFS